MVQAAVCTTPAAMCRIPVQEDEEADLAAVISRLKEVLSVSEDAEVQLVSIFGC